MTARVMHPAVRLGRSLLPLLALLACEEAPAPEVQSPPARAGVPAPTPPSRGMDSVRLEAAYQRAAELPRLRSLLVARHGTLYGERYYAGAGPDGYANVKSVSKSVLSALVGIAIAEGALAGTEQPIGEFFPEHLRGEQDARKRRITIGQLLSMQSGLQSTSFSEYGEWVSSPNWVRDALRRPMVAEPGGRMLYSTGSTHLLSAILTRATGRSTHEYAREKLGRPLGIEIPRWTRDPQGIYFGGNEMRLRPRDMLRFGELYRNGGEWEGRQVVPRDWIERSWRQRTSSPFNGHGYGYGWWMRRARGHPVYFAWGYGGQFIFVVPDLDLTVVATSDASSARDGGHLRAMHALLDHSIIPAAEVGGATATAWHPSFGARFPQSSRPS